jgi:hypothetical protein
MSGNDSDSLGDEATLAGRSRRQRADASLGDERTLGDGLSSRDTVIDHIEVVDLEARYRIEGPLGKGGMGAVMLATDTRLGRKVAVKRILGEAAGNRMSVTRFLTEAKSIAALNHPNIVQIYDYGRAADGPFLIMEYVDGGSLLDRCQAGAVPLEEAIDLACQLCDGLAKAHDLGIIHRDIKPANVLLTRDGVPKLTDFGLAKAEAGDHGQTMTGAVLGTPDFMPPEQRRDASLVDHRSDLWSLAATVYQMVTGRSPKIIRFDLLPAELTTALGKALEEAKDDRFQSARELRDSLKLSLRAAVPGDAASMASAEGQCPSCGVKNDTSRKFCRGCGGALVVPCLSCDRPMPPWEQICGQCGVRQAELLADRQAASAAEQARAEGLLGDLEFQKAIDMAAKLGRESHPTLGHLGPWSTEFVVKAEEARRQHMLRAADELADAARHEAAHDYLSAIFALEMVAPALHGQPLPGAGETIAAALARIKAKQVESTRLDKLVRDRIASRQVDGLLPEVARLLELQPDRRDLGKLRQQLEERDAKLAAVRDAAIASASAHLSRHDYEAALAELSRIHETVDTPQSRQLRERTARTVARLKELVATIRGMVAGKQMDGLLPIVEEFLRLKPGDPEAMRISDTITARQKKSLQDVEAACGRARDLMKACEFEAAVRVLEAVSAASGSASTQELLWECRSLATLRANALQSLDAAQSEGDVSSGLAAADSYRQVLAHRDLTDDAFVERWRRCEEGVSRRRLQRTIARVGAIGGGVLAAIVGIVVLGSMVGVGSARPTTTSPVGATATSVSGPAVPVVGASVWDWYYQPVGNSIGLRFVRVPAGEVVVVNVKALVDSRYDDSRRALRRDKIARPFLISQTEVTQSQWREVMKSEPWKGRSADGDRLPVTFVTRGDAVAFCVALTNRETGEGMGGILGGRPLGRACTPGDVGTMTGVYSLPTSDQWDYACTATRQTGPDAASLGRYAWTVENSGKSVHDVALKSPNAIGLYDMHGNVQELCLGETRGGSWNTTATVSTAERYGNYGSRGGPTDEVGFRVIVELE